MELQVLSVMCQVSWIRCPLWWDSTHGENPKFHVHINLILSPRPVPMAEDTMPRLLMGFTGRGRGYISTDVLILSSGYTLKFSCLYQDPGNCPLESEEDIIKPKMKQFLDEYFPKDGKNKYRFIAIALIGIYGLFCTPALMEYENIFFTADDAGRGVAYI